MVKHFLCLLLFTLPCPISCHWLIMLMCSPVLCLTLISLVCSILSILGHILAPLLVKSEPYSLLPCFLVLTLLVFSFS